MHSGKFLDFGSNTINSFYQCGGKFTFSDISLTDITAGHYSIQNHNNKFFYSDSVNDQLTLDDKLSIWRIYDTQDRTFSLQSFSSL